MTQRVRRYPPLNARLVVLEEGPPMYRQLGYADKNNLHTDLCDPLTPAYFGPFSIPRLPPNQILPVGPGRYGLPMRTLPYTTLYWDDCAFPSHMYVARRPTNRLYHGQVVLEERPEARCIPERAVPGTGVNSKCKDSGYLYVPGLPQPHAI